jgi:hypothetical protein
MRVWAGKVGAPGRNDDMIAALAVPEHACSKDASSRPGSWPHWLGCPLDLALFQHVHVDAQPNSQGQGQWVLHQKVLAGEDALHCTIHQQKLAVHLNRGGGGGRGANNTTVRAWSLRPSCPHNYSYRPGQHGPYIDLECGHNKDGQAVCNHLGTGRVWQSVRRKLSVTGMVSGGGGGRGGALAAASFALRRHLCTPRCTCSTATSRTAGVLFVVIVSLAVATTTIVAAGVGACGGTPCHSSRFTGPHVQSKIEVG